MGQFPCKYNFGDIVKFKYRSHGIVNGIIVGVIIGGSNSDDYYADYKVNSLEGQEPEFYFELVAEHHLIKE